MCDSRQIKTLYTYVKSKWIPLKFLIMSSCKDDIRVMSWLWKSVIRKEEEEIQKRVYLLQSSAEPEITEAHPSP